MFYVDPVLHHGRPDPEGRLSKELACYDLLENLGIDFWRADHDPADTIEDCEEVEKVIGVDICKNLFLCNRSQTEFYLLLMPGRKSYRTSVFSKLIGSSRLSFAKPEHLLEYLDLTPGSVSIMGLINDLDCRVKLAIDRDVLNAPFIRCHPCINTSTLKIATDDVLNILLPALGHKPTIVEL